MANEITLKIKTAVDTANSAESLGKISKSLKELKGLQEQVDRSSPDFKKLSDAINKTEGRIGDLNDSFKLLTGSGVERLNSSVGLLKEGFGNLDLDKIKMSFKSFGAVLKDSGPQIILFILIDIVKTIIENFDKLVNMFPILGAAVKAVTDAFHWLTDKLGLTSKAQRELEEQGEKLIKQAEKTKEALANTTSEYDRQIAAAKAAGKSTVAIEIAKQDAIIKTNKAYLEQVIAHGRAGGQITAEQLKIVNEQLNAIKDAENAKLVIYNTTEKEKEDKAKESYKKNKELSDKKAEEDAKENEKKLDILDAYLTSGYQANVDQAQKILDYNKAVNKELERIDAEKNKKNKEAKEKELVELDIAIKKSILSYEDITKRVVLGTRGAALGFSYLHTSMGDAAASITSSFSTAFDTISNKSTTTTDKVQAGLGSVASMISAISALQSQLTREEIDSIESRTNATINNLNIQRDAELNAANLTANQKTAIQQKYAMQEYKLKLDAYTKETAIKKKAFEQNKKMSIATTIIQGAMGAIQAFNSLSVIPVVGTILGGLAAAAVGVMTAIQVSKISQTKFEGGSPPSPPQFNAPDAGSITSQPAPSSGEESKKAATTPELQKIGNGSQQQPMQVYVVSESVTASQDMSKTLERRATF